MLFSKQNKKHAKNFKNLTKNSNNSMMNANILRENSSHLNVFTSPTSSYPVSNPSEKENQQPHPIKFVKDKQQINEDPIEITAKFTLDITETKQKLLTIFTFYSSFGDRKNLKLLKSTKFHKMMSDSGLKDHALNQQRLDLLFMAETQHRSHIDFEGFLRLLIKVAAFKHQTEPNDPSALKKVIWQNMEPLYQCILKETDMGMEKTHFLKEIDEKAINLLAMASNSLNRIYLGYFPWEPKSFQSKEEIRRRSESSLLIFLKDFEICPNIMTKSKAFLLFNEVLSTSKPQLSQYFSSQEDQGVCFSYHRFLLFLYRLAIDLCVFSQTSPEQEDFSEEAVRSLLERMELSTGFMCLEKRLNVPMNSRFSLRILPNNQTLQSVGVSLVSEDQRSKNCASKYEENLLQNEEESAVINEILSEWDEPLKKVFGYYSSLGEPLNTKYMKSIKFKRFLKEANVQQCMDQNSIDLLFIKYKGKTGKLEYDGFLKSLAQIAKRLRPEDEHVAAFQWFFKNFLEEFLVKLDEIRRELDINSVTASSKPENHVQLLMDLLQDNEILDLLGTVHKSLRFFYEAYAKCSGLMDFEAFVRFAKDFDIFPTLITKARLLKIFETLSTVFQRTSGPQQEFSTNINNYCNNSDLIDEHLFVEGLALCAFEVTYEEPEPNSFEKVYYFLEKINQSEGVAAVQKKKGVGLKAQNWDLLQEYKRKMGINRISVVSNLLGKQKEDNDFEALLRK